MEALEERTKVLGFNVLCSDYKNKMFSNLDHVINSINGLVWINLENDILLCVPYKAKAIINNGKLKSIEVDKCTVTDAIKIGGSSDEDKYIAIPHLSELDIKMIKQSVADYVMSQAQDKGIEI